MKKFLKITSLALFLAGTDVKVSAQLLPGWAIGPFVRPHNAGPIIKPDTTSFLDPMTNKKVKWEESDTFNPAATVKNGKIYILYRSCWSGFAIPSFELGICNSVTCRKSFFYQLNFGSNRSTKISSEANQVV